MILKVFSILIGVVLLCAHLLLNIVLNLIPDYQFIPIREILNGHMDTLLGAATLSWFVDVISASILYLIAICTENNFLQIINRVNKIRINLPPMILKKKSKSISVGLLLSISPMVLAFLTNLQTEPFIWTVLYIFGSYVIDVISARQLSSIYLIYVTTCEVHLTIRSSSSVTRNKRLYYQLLEDISELLATFQRSNHIQILVFSIRLLMSNVTLIYAACYLFSNNILKEASTNFLINFLAVYILNLKFIIFTYYCERTVVEFHLTTKSLQSRREQEGDCDKTNVQCLHNSTTSITSFGLFAVDRKFAYLVSVKGLLAANYDTF